MKTTRREFLKKVVGYLPIIAVGSLSLPLLRLMFYAEGRREIKFIVPLEKLVSKVTKFTKPPLFIVKLKRSELIALDSHCTHMGCIVNFDRKRNIFVCPCHGSEYNIEGINIKGPTKKPLHRERLKIVDGKIVVDYIYYKIS